VVSEKLNARRDMKHIYLPCFDIFSSHFSEPLETVVSTVGFSRVSLTHKGCCVAIYDLGGGPKIRGIWHRYFADVSKSLYVQLLNEVKILYT
jgi:hypothetical protein